MSTAHAITHRPFTTRTDSSFLKNSMLLGRLLVGQAGDPDQAQYQAFYNSNYEGDPIADALAEWIMSKGFIKGMDLFNKALEQGVNQTQGVPDVMRAFFEEVEREPFWVDHALLEKGQRALQRSGLVMIQVLGVLLVGGFATASGVNKSLVMTGALQKGSSVRRLGETLGWWLDVTATGGMSRFRKGFITTLRVRLLHAIVRLKLRQREDWDFENWGMPISQSYMAATNQGFATGALTLVRALGVRYSREEREAIMHLWRYVGWLSGVEERYCPATEREGIRIIRLAVETSPHPDQDAVALARDYIESEIDGARYRGLGKWLNRMHQRTHMGMVRMAIGKADCEVLELDRYPFSRGFPAFVAATSLVTESLRSVLPGSDKVYAKAGREIQKRVLALLDDMAREQQYQPFDERKNGKHLKQVKVA